MGGIPVNFSMPLALHWCAYFNQKPIVVPQIPHLLSPGFLFYRLKKLRTSIQSPLKIHFDLFGREGQFDAKGRLTQTTPLKAPLEI